MIIWGGSGSTFFMSVKNKDVLCPRPYPICYSPLPPFATGGINSVTWHFYGATTSCDERAEKKTKKPKPSLKVLENI